MIADVSENARLENELLLHIDKYIPILIHHQKKSDYIFEKKVVTKNKEVSELDIKIQYGKRKRFNLYEYENNIKSNQKRNNIIYTFIGIIAAISIIFGIYKIINHDVWIGIYIILFGISALFSYEKIIINEYFNAVRDFFGFLFVFCGIAMGIQLIISFHIIWGILSIVLGIIIGALTGEF